MMHDAYEANQLLKLNVQIDSIAAYDDKLLVGTSKGHLLMYSVSFRLGERKNDVQLLGYHKMFSKKPIQQMAVVPEYQLLISLSDSVVSVHDMTTINFSLITTVKKTRGASLFSLDIKKCQSLTGRTSTTVRLCVAVKRRLQLFYWKNNQFHDLREDLCVPDIPKALVWCGETICVGFKGEYCLLELTGEQKELFPTGKNLEPSITRLADNSLALGKDSQTILMDTKGTPAQKFPIKWSDVPTHIAHDDPYLLGIVNDTVEVRSVDPYLHIQSIQLQRPQLIHCVRQGKVFVSSGIHVWCLQAVSVSRQIHNLLEEKQFQLALKLANISDEPPEEKKKNIYHIQTLYAFHLFSNRKFKESMNEFLKLGTDPCEVIRLFPDLMPQLTGSQVNKAPVKLEEEDLEDGLLALIEYLTEVRNKLRVDIQPSGNEDIVSGSSNSKSTEQLLQIIDTTLLKCYLKTNDALVAPLLRLNHCHLAETEKNLKKYQKYSELIILYQTKGLHHKALELLKKQATIPESSLRGHEKTVQYLQHLGKDNIALIFEFAGWVLKSHPEEGLKIFIEDEQEVEQLPRPQVLDYLLRTQKSLVIPYLEHVVMQWGDTNPLFHNALIHQYQERVQQLMNEELNKSPAKAKDDAEGNVEPIDYSPSESEKTHHMKPRAGEEPGELGQIRKKLLSFLEASAYYTPETVLVHFPYDCLYEEKAIVLGKLGHHEQVLSLYISFLQDIQQAINYCEKTYQLHCEGYDEVYVILIKMLINPPESWILGVQPVKPPKPDVDLALELLSQNASKMNPMKALSVLPDDVPLWKVKKFMETSLHGILNERRNVQVLRGLLAAEYIQVKESKIHHESQSIVMTEFNVCPVCKKRFGNQSAFARYPNGDIVHYSCQEKKA
ncbi:vam6/Vps39-like protein [Ischnura elegans]|uniref:vam6/Vps39-like protein n=1 Tax=Ischnura elegans TaxID=197161 RepID=UPI001ED89E2B|nr:vam6/Vps39-like protein [Ischnura elegans]